MSSTSPIIPDDTIWVIKAARLANAEAQARLAAAFESGWRGEAGWDWKQPLEDPERTIHFLDRDGLEQYACSPRAPFWSRILTASLDLFTHPRFKDIPVVLAAFALDEISARSKPRAQHLGLKHSVVFHTNTRAPVHGFKYSISKPSLDARLAELKRSSLSSGANGGINVEQRGIGLCVTKDRLSELFGQLQFIHVDSDGKAFLTDTGDGDQPAGLLTRLVAEIRADSPDAHLWEAYMNGFSHLVTPDSRIHCHLSATSLFHSLINQRAHAAAHLVFGFGAPPKREQALLVYHCFQIVLSGLPALYSSMRRLRQEAADLAKYKQMVQLLEPPLKRISGVLGQMQSDTQELRAVLYEPEEALFASYSLVEPYFRNGSTLSFQTAGLPPIQSKHSYTLHEADEIQLITAVVLCAVFGEDKQLFDQEDRDLVLSKAASIMRRVSSQQSSARMAADLAWLVGRNNLASLFEKLPSTAGDSIKKACTDALTSIKAALFTPFKPDATKWPEAALQLLHRHEDLKDSDLAINGQTRSFARAPEANTLMLDPQKSFPCSYSTVLTFIRDFATAAKASRNPAVVKKLTFDKKTKKFVVTLTRSPAVDVEFIQTNCKQVLAASRDWRIENANYGDMTRAFVLFANRLMGIGSEWKTADKYSKEEIIRAEKIGAVFSVAWSEKKTQLVIQSKTP